MHEIIEDLNRILGELQLLDVTVRVGSRPSHSDPLGMFANVQVNYLIDKSSNEDG